ncbi:hypothetical protein BDN72DRAFT_831426 [Pluteus cervinus]|uniref:Uncharacterized protein n=1 Tax=Pluteus cervinus TaxID=181527 RepID=A0ACD3BCT9_9AGAR|nr:hypothetical protein BDN72DRAFT_831426 [Pluteus cervinus]
MFSREQYVEMCHAFLSLRSEGSLKNTPRGWRWQEHHSVPGLGFISRSATYLKQPSFKDAILSPDLNLVDLEPEDDESVASVPPVHLVNSQQFVAYSPTFQVPTFYFTLHGANGSPLSLDEIMQCNVFKLGAFEGTERSTFALTIPDSSFPLLSQGDHPVLGTPCWYLHPCQASQAVDELVAEITDESGESKDGLKVQNLASWLETWFMVVGTVINW